MSPPPGRFLADVPVVVLAAHGGCGATTVAAHLPGTREVTLAVARNLRAERCAVVASATVDGLASAADTVRVLHRSLSQMRLHLVLVRDGRGPAPLGARTRVRTLSALVDDVVELPHVARWRYEHHDARGTSRRYLRALGVLADRLGTPAPRATAEPDRRLVARMAGHTGAQPAPVRSDAVRPSTAAARA